MCITTKFQAKRYIETHTTKNQNEFHAIRTFNDCIFVANRQFFLLFNQVQVCMLPTFVIKSM